MATTGTNPDGTERKRLDQLPRQAALATWPTPSAAKNTKNSKDPQRMKENGVQTALADAAWLTDSGETPSGSPAVTTNTVAPKLSLNPSLSRFLMGLPLIWDLCAMKVSITSTRSRGKRRTALEGSEATETQL
jgi:hypothetical protein